MNTSKQHQPMGRYVFRTIFLLTFVALIGLADKNLTMAAETAFPVSDYYGPLVHIGDIGDVQVSPLPDHVQLNFELKGGGPDACDFKFNGNTSPPPTPCRFAGVMWLHDALCFGTREECGYDLSNVSGEISWEARSTQGDVYAEFVAGGIQFRLDQDSRKKVFDLPFPDSMPQTSFRLRHLTKEWQQFSYSFGTNSTLRPEHFKHVVGAFGIVVHWSSNGVRLASDWEERLYPDWEERIKNERPISKQPLAEKPRKIIIEIRNILYKKK